MIRSTGLSVIVLVLLTFAGELAAQEPAAESGPVLVGGTEIILVPPETPLERLDESNKKNQAALQSFWPTNDANLLLGVYAEAAAWRSFMKGWGKSGAPAATLDFYALATTPENLANDRYSEDDFLAFKKVVVQVNQAAKVIDDQPRALTFRTIITPPDNDDLGRIRMITSVILVEGKVVYLTVFDNNKSKHKDLMPALALAWRDACLAANRP